MRSYRIWSSFIQSRMASRILGMGDVLSLIEKAEAEIDEDQAKADDSEAEEDISLTYNDYLESMQQMKKMGGMSGILEHAAGNGSTWRQGMKDLR